jgi:hypothetical protein
MATLTASTSRSATVLRVAAAVLGGYAFCWGFLAFALAGLYALGMAFHDAEHLGAILAFLLYVAAFCWAFVTPSLWRAWIVLAGGGAAMAAAASWLQHLILV